jgi:hypothetical protein
MNEAVAKWNEKWKSYVEGIKDKRAPQLSERSFDFLCTLVFKDASVQPSAKLEMEFLIHWRGMDYCFTYEDSVGSDSWKVHSLMGTGRYRQSITDFFGSYGDAVVVRKCFEEFGVETMARDIQMWKDADFERMFTERFSGMRIAGTKRNGDDVYFILENGEEIKVTSFYEISRKKHQTSYKEI